jgi:hypothetical protein
LFFWDKSLGTSFKKNSDLEQPRKLEICGKLEGDLGSPQGEVDLAIWQNNKVKRLQMCVCVCVCKNDPLVGFIKGQTFMAHIVLIYQFCIGERPECRPFS